MPLLAKAAGSKAMQQYLTADLSESRRHNPQSLLGVMVQEVSGERRQALAQALGRCAIQEKSRGLQHWGLPALAGMAPAQLTDWTKPLRRSQLPHSERKAQPDGEQPSNRASYSLSPKPDHSLLRSSGGSDRVLQFLSAALISRLIEDTFHSHTPRPHPPTPRAFYSLIHLRFLITGVSIACGQPCDVTSKEFLCLTGAKDDHSECEALWIDMQQQTASPLWANNGVLFGGTITSAGRERNKHTPRQKSMTCASAYLTSTR
ncbi:hypothetical protein Q8A73_021902 [Channa argus]|nr:hypothetical protein Q8A73_021902 [Channa argus]